MATSGSLVRWLARVSGGASLDTLDAEAAATPPGAGGIVCLPYFLGEKSPLHDPALRGAFVGLHLGHERGHLHRAALEAVAYGFRHHVEVFAERGVALGAGPRHQRRQPLDAVEADPRRRARRGAGAGARPSRRLPRRRPGRRGRHWERRAGTRSGRWSSSGTRSSPARSFASATTSCTPSTGSSSRRCGRSHIVSPRRSGHEQSNRRRHRSGVGHRRAPSRASCRGAASPSSSPTSTATPPPPPSPRLEGEGWSEVLDVTDADAAGAARRRGGRAPRAARRVGAPTPGISHMARVHGGDARPISTARWPSTSRGCSSAARPRRARCGGSAGAASIVNLASMAGKQGRVPYLSDYVASKFGVVGLTQAMAFELAADSIRVNCVCPGYRGHRRCRSASWPGRRSCAAWLPTRSSSCGWPTRRWAGWSSRRTSPAPSRSSPERTPASSPGEALAVNGGAFMD